MKNLKEQSWGILETQKESFDYCYKKAIYLRKWLIANFPEDIKADFNIDFMGYSTIRCFIYLNVEDMEGTEKVIKWIAKLKNFKKEKFWREEKGMFSYKLERTYKGNYKFDDLRRFDIDYIIFIENTANIDGCVIKKKRKMITVYETDCEKKKLILN